MKPDPNSPVTPIPLETLRLLRNVTEPGEAVRPIPGTARYFATDRGSIISVLRGRALRLRSCPQSRGYLQVCLYLEDKTVWCPLVHRAVALAFYGPRPVDELGRPYQIHHIDGDPLNNFASNLVYIPALEHNRLTARGESGCAKLTAEGVWIGRCRLLTEQFADVVAGMAEEAAVIPATVSMALRGRTWADVPFPGDQVTYSQLARILGVPFERAIELLALASPGSGRRAA